MLSMFLRCHPLIWFFWSIPIRVLLQVLIHLGVPHHERPLHEAGDITAQEAQTRKVYALEFGLLLVIWPWCSAQQTESLLSLWMSGVGVPALRPKSFDSTIDLIRSTSHSYMFEAEVLASACSSWRSSVVTRKLGSGLEVHCPRGSGSCKGGVDHRWATNRLRAAALP